MSSLVVYPSRYIKAVYNNSSLSVFTELKGEFHSYPETMGFMGKSRKIRPFPENPCTKKETHPFRLSLLPVFSVFLTLLVFAEDDHYNVLVQKFG